MRARYLSHILVLALLPNMLWAARPSISSLQQQINQLSALVNQQQVQIDALEAAEHTPALKLYAESVFLGYLIFGSNNELFIYEPSSGYFALLLIEFDGVNDVISLARRVIYFENLDCDGNGLIINSNGSHSLELYSDTPNILFMNGDNYYKTTGVYDGPKNILFQSRFEVTDGSCTSGFSESFGNQNAKFEQVGYPLPYLLPLTVTNDGLRLELVNP